jgi:hypothetical protein
VHRPAVDDPDQQVGSGPTCTSRAHDSENHRKAVRGDARRKSPLTRDFVGIANGGRARRSALRSFDTAEVTGSIPVAPTQRILLVIGGFFNARRDYCHLAATTGDQSAIAQDCPKYARPADTLRTPAAANTNLTVSHSWAVWLTRQVHAQMAGCSRSVQMEGPAGESTPL